MFKLNKKGSSKSVKKMKNTIALKRSVYAVILSVIFIVGAVLLTVLSSVLSARFPLNLDLTTDKIHTMTNSNIDFIKGINRKVNIYVCLTEDEYSCKGSSSYNMAYYAATEKFVDYNAENATYYSQTVELLNKYAQYNDNITVTYLDVAQPDAKEITANFDEYMWNTGDILVESTVEQNGKQITRRTTVPFKETYTLEAGNTDTSNYESYYKSGYLECYALYGVGIGYMITQNNIEQTLSAAVYKVISDTTPVFLIPASYCNVDTLKEVLDGTLTTNNYQLEYADGLLSTLLSAENQAKYTGIIMSDCTADISLEDRDILETFLDNNGQKGKSLVFFAGTETYKYKNLCGFLGDWGIGFESGTLYESSANYSSDNGTQILMASRKTDYTTNADSLSNNTYVSAQLVPMTQLYSANTTATYVRESEVLMSTASNKTVTIMPIDQKAGEWKPASDAKYDVYATAIMTKDAVSLNGKFVSSFVTAFASTDIISDNWNRSLVANVNFTLDVFNASVGISDSPFNFVAKTITNESYAANVTKSSENIVKYTFMLVIPLALFVTGIAVWIRRRSK